MSAEKAVEQTERKQLVEAVAASQKVAKAKAYAASLREKASKVTNPRERERLVKEAYEKEVEAHGQSKLAKRLQSGLWQGGAAGGGIGLGTGLGLGTVVGTLVGGVLSIPTTGLGILGGAIFGAINGPIIKVGGKEKKWEEASPDEVVDAFEQEQRDVQGQLASAGAGESSLPYEQAIGPRPKGKPRKLEIRSQKAVDEASQPAPDGESPTGTPPRRPRKLESRSKSRTDTIQRTQSYAVQPKDGNDSGYAEEG